MAKDYVVTRMAEDKTTQLQEILEYFNLSSYLHRFVPTTKNASVPCAKGREGHPWLERLLAGSAVVVHPREKAPTVAPWPWERVGRQVAPYSVEYRHLQATRSTQVADHPILIRLAGVSHRCVVTCQPAGRHDTLPFLDGVTI